MHACHHFRLGVAGSLDEEVWLRQETKQGFDRVARSGGLGELAADVRGRLWELDTEGSPSRLLVSLSERTSTSIFGVPWPEGKPVSALRDCAPLVALLAAPLEEAADVPRVVSEEQARAARTAADDDAAMADIAPQRVEPVAAVAVGTGNDLPLVHSLVVARDREWLH